ncbi:hypothetical protein N0B51_00060 [Tsuneonella sp. YG55]|uniref:Uncharacterized protein n=1 Tax=Tsuneonella litorea TaxID=2976475 RepID=A0A9X2VYU2_9SPHN|nr:hypothetical protein [Tsuneonella litorea]MCT2557369.1 hypothetical protein [Tsuneonella litorea]
MNVNFNPVTAANEPFDPKRDPATRQSHVSIRAFGIEFHSRYGVLAELRMMILAVDTWLSRGLFWHIDKIDFDSKGGSVCATLKQRDDPLDGIARQIASTLKLHLGDRCLSVFVVNHAGTTIAESRG